MKAADRIGVVRPRYSVARRILFPIYGRDQLIFFSVFLLAVLVAAVYDPKLGLYMGVGGYVGSMIMMEISTPSALLLPADCEERLVRLLDEAPLLKRTDNSNEWMSSTGRMYRWDSDIIRLCRTADGLLVTGRHYDLWLMAEELGV
jgi:hypothetical protein